MKCDHTHNIINCNQFLISVSIIVIYIYIYIYIIIIIISVLYPYSEVYDSSYSAKIGQHESASVIMNAVLRGHSNLFVGVPYVSIYVYVPTHENWTLCAQNMHVLHTCLLLQNLQIPVLLV